MSDAPFFSVVMATYNRGHHIVPSIQSVLRQTRQDFELLVIGDHCTDDTEGAVAPFLSDRVSWSNLPEPGGSQTFPNNAGIAKASGRYIAYLGHDDIWSPDHLASLAECFEADTRLDFAVSGALLHMAPGVESPFVTGLFGTEDSPRRHFFPPSSFAHRRDATDRIGPWRNPLETSKPVDADLLDRAAEAGLTFRSTGRVTVHKFAAVHRYLSYLVLNSTEQSEMLDRLGTPEFPAFVQRQVNLSKQLDQFMAIANRPVGANSKPGAWLGPKAERRGISRPPLVQLDGSRLIRQRRGHYARDWHPDPQAGILWTFENPRPRFLLSFTSRSRASLAMTIAHPLKSALTSLEFGPGVSGLVLSRPTKVGDGWQALARFDVDMSENQPTVLEFRLQGGQVPARTSRGLGIGDIVIATSAEERDARLARRRRKSRTARQPDQKGVRRIIARTFRAIKRIARRHRR